MQHKGLLKLQITGAESEREDIDRFIASAKTALPGCQIKVKRFTTGEEIYKPEKKKREKKNAHEE
jgi:hypothetical protein